MSLVVQLAVSDLECEGENSPVNVIYVNVGYVHRLAERWRANVHELLNPEEE
jgi:hypothetical protein